MSVSTKDFFRPAPDPEITDHEAEIDFPSTQYSTLFRTNNTTELMLADQACDSMQCPACDQTGNCGFTDYQNYIKNRGKYIHPSSKPYRWTGLGYTYDWGSADIHAGLCEFVLHGKKIRWE
jgi:hypothetical protein